jgi:hypothetical protein
MQSGWRYYRNWSGATPYIEWIAQNPPPGHSGYNIMEYDTDLQNWGTYKTYTVTWLTGTVWCGQYANHPPMCSDVGISSPRLFYAHSEVHSSALNELNTIFKNVHYMDSTGNCSMKRDG